jgi:iron-sulfur cluster repair protein YtfE (RIC family)
MRTFLLTSSCIFLFAISAYGDQAQQQAMQQAYEKLVQIDGQIESLVKQKLQLKAEVAQHMERENTSIRPRVDRRQEMQIQELSQQIQALSQEIAELDEKRSTILLSLQ